MLGGTMAALQKRAYQIIGHFTLETEQIHKYRRREWREKGRFHKWKSEFKRQEACKWH